jgi:hypothetical protein
MRKTNMLEGRKELTLEEMIQRGKITSKTFDRVSIVKSYIEKKYSLKTQKTDEKNKGKNNQKIIYIIIFYRLGTY